MTNLQSGNCIMTITNLLFVTAYVSCRLFSHSRFFLLTLNKIRFIINNDKLCETDDQEKEFSEWILE